MRKNIGCSKTGHHRIRLAVRNQAHNLCKRGTTFCANANPASMKSTTYTDKARFAVQVGFVSAGDPPYLFSARVSDRIFGRAPRGRALSGRRIVKSRTAARSPKV